MPQVSRAGLLCPAKAAQGGCEGTQSHTTCWGAASPQLLSLKSGSWTRAKRFLSVPAPALHPTMLLAMVCPGRIFYNLFEMAVFLSCTSVLQVVSLDLFTDVVSCVIPELLPNIYRQKKRFELLWIPSSWGTKGTSSPFGYLPNSGCCRKEILT